MDIPSLKLTVRPWKWAFPNGKACLPSIFRGKNPLLVSGRVSLHRPSQNLGGEPKWFISRVQNVQCCSKIDGWMDGWIDGLMDWWIDSGQIIPTSRDLTPKGSWGREISSYFSLVKYYNLARLVDWCTLPETTILQKSAIPNSEVLNFWLNCLRVDGITVTTSGCSKREATSEHLCAGDFRERKVEDCEKLLPPQRLTASLPLRL